MPVSRESLEAHAAKEQRRQPLYDAVIEYATRLAEADGIGLTESIKIVDGWATYHRWRFMRGKLEHRVQFGKDCINDSMFGGNKVYFVERNLLYKGKKRGPIAVWCVIVEEIAHAAQTEYWWELTGTYKKPRGGTAHDSTFLREFKRIWMDNTEIGNEFINDDRLEVRG